MPNRPLKNSVSPFSGKQSLAPRLESLPQTYFFAPDIEREINRLEGVTLARVLSTGSAIDEIHVVVPHERTPKKIVRDIESLLLVRFGMRIDHRCISIVQMDHLQPAYPRYQRPQIQQVVRVEGGVNLVLGVGDKVIVGQAPAVGDGDDLVLVGRAVINAVEQLVQTPGILALLKTHIAEMDTYRVVLVLARWVYGQQQELLTGASLIYDDPLEAMARAMLDAINRRLVKFESGQ